MSNISSGESFVITLIILGALLWILSTVGGATSSTPYPDGGFTPDSGPEAQEY